MTASGGSHEDQLIEGWLAAFNEAVDAHDCSRVSALFTPDGFLRDLVALTWHFRTFQGRAEVEEGWAIAQDVSAPRGFRLTGPGVTKRKLKVDGTDVVETVLDFETKAGAGRAVLRLMREADGVYRAWLLATALDGLNGAPEQIGTHRPVGSPSLDTFGGKNWLDRRTVEQTYGDVREPEVLVVGAGQSGLAVAARLRALGVDALLIDRLPRVGDVWRNRYHSLTLHNAVWMNHLPYMPFPDTWPVYIPKDKLANWFESYADAMELNVWTSTEICSAVYDDDDRRWTAELRSGDGQLTTVRPAHIVMATGVSGIPRWPVIPGLDTFAGKVMHSAQYRAPDPTATRALVFGTGNSAHDVAQDLHMNGGCSVSMVQRSSTTVVDFETVHKIYDRLSKRLSPELADLMLVATPYALATEAFRSMTDLAKERDRELISRLESAGFRTDYGEDGTGHRMKYLRHGGGYYINVGCSDLIADGRIDVIRSEQVESVVPEGVRLTDGRVIELDLIVLATGYEGQSVLVEKLFGKDVADRVGPIWGYDEAGELQGMYKRVAQPGLWFHAGSLTQSRVYSKLLALQIKACLDGTLEPGLPTPQSAGPAGAEPSS